MMASNPSVDDTTNRPDAENQRQDHEDDTVSDQNIHFQNLFDSGSQEAGQEFALTSNSMNNTRAAEPTEQVERQDPPTPLYAGHSHSQHNLIARNQPTTPAQLRVNRSNRNILPYPYPALGQHLLLGQVQPRQNRAQDDQPSVSQQGQPEQRDMAGEVSPPLVLRENQAQGTVQQQQQPPQLIRSGRSHIHSFVRFVNQTSRNVNILWLNYEGSRVRYKTLHPNQFVDVNTFVGHPWIFRDADTGDKLVVQMKEVYEPVAYTVNEGWPPQRRVVKISIPVYSLQERCMQVVRDLVPADKVNQLEIPQFLRQVIQQLIATKSPTVSPPVCLQSSAVR